MNWRIKGVVQKGLSILPGGVKINDLLQRNLGEMAQFEEHIVSKVSDWKILVSHMTDLEVRTEGLRYLEIGTGWIPTLPICYALSGSSSCLSFDLRRHLDSGLTFQMLNILESQLQNIALANRRPLSDVRTEYDQLRQATSVDDLFRRARIEYHAPADASATGLPSASVDVAFSNSVLEHVVPEVIARMMKESRRILRPGGLSIHSVNCGDHYAYFDKDITAINYLTYSSREWKFWDNEILYQNRLRAQDFLCLAEEAGLEIVWQKYRPRKDLMEALATLRIAPEFQKYSKDQLCSTSIDFVARKNG